MSGPPSSLIENYLREAGFWHMATIGRECKLDSKLISVLIKRWRPETHTFHLPCGECTITLEDVNLQLGLSVDGTQSSDPFNLVIGKQYATSFWVLFWIVLTEVRSRWAGYETHSRSRMMILSN
ncbi:hypothetical protein Gotur_005419 [Gossypium turneri]